MKTLLVTCRLSDGSEKIHRFSAEQGRFVVGSSRKADLRLPKPAQIIEGVIERDETGWTYHSFAIKEDKAPIIYNLSNTKQIKIGDVVLLTEVKADVSFFSVPEKVKPLPPEAKVGTGTSLQGAHQQVILVYFQDELLTTRYCEVGKTCEIDLYSIKLQIKTTPTADWLASTEGEYQILQKSIARGDLSVYKVPLKDYFPKEKQDRWIGAGLMATLLIGMISSFFADGPAQFRADAEPPKTTSPIVVKLSPTQQRKAKAAAAAPDQQTADNNTAAPATKMDRLKRLAAFGKAGLFLKKAVRMPASIGPNGKLALAAAGVGRLDGPTTDWKAMAGSRVSGKVGGGGLSGGTGTGTQLSAGGTGASGLSLLDQESEVTGGLDKEIIAQFIRKNIGHILYCYERSLSANPNLFGKVSVKFTIGGKGNVETQKIGESTLRNGTVESCILEKISRWKFPEPKGGVQVVVTYPFLFKTTN